jgi:hypothetical protein
MRFFIKSGGILLSHPSPDGQYNLLEIKKTFNQKKTSHKLMYEVFY